MAAEITDTISFLVKLKFFVLIIIGGDGAQGSEYTTSGGNLTQV